MKRKFKRVAKDKASGLPKKYVSGAKSKTSQAREIKDTAQTLSVSRTTLYKRIRESASLRTAADLTRDEIEAAHEQCDGDLEAMFRHVRVSKRGLRQRMKELGFSL